jgi:16S rRNA (cytosine967-C5)-methyltransferase
MTPQARLSAAIEVLDRILAGAVAEQALTNWGRASRFAGSGDRHAVRDLVYDALRCKLSYAALGGAETGRGLVLGGLRDKGLEVAGLFTGEGHAPAPVSDFEAGGRPDELAALDCPDWLAPRLRTSLGADFAGVLQAMRQRAPVFLRVNQIKASLDEAQGALAAEGIATELTDLAKFGLRVAENPRKIQNSAAYVEGMVELQDAASQAVIEALPLADDQRVLDYCCGGGGKALAMAARAKITLFCHDAEARRMRDLPARAQRAGVAVEILENPSLSAPYDVVLTDVPCSGSGSWRRDPQGKWALTEAKLSDLLQSQAEILDRAAVLVSAKGTLAYVTCSMLRDENEAQIEAFVTRHPDWICLQKQSFSPLSGADGFFLAVLTRRP